MWLLEPPEYLGLEACQVRAEGIRLDPAASTNEILV